MAKQSAGLLIYRKSKTQATEILLVHPGGPFYVKKDNGFWSIPKGEIEENEDPFAVALREFEEETGNTLPDNLSFTPLTNILTRSGKKVQVWAAEYDFAQPYISSNPFPLEWPPKSGKTQFFPEADTAEWFDLKTARLKIYPFQLPLITDLELQLGLITQKNT